jgi:heterodisulfide reductase subunit C
MKQETSLEITRQTPYWTGIDRQMTQQIKEHAKTDFQRCLQCRSCSGGCPFIEAMDLGPHRIIRMLQLGFVQNALRTSTIWICVGCDTCSSQCPMAIDIAAIMDVLRQKAVSEKVSVPTPEIVDLHTEILNSIYRYGRTHKLEIMLRYKVQTQTWFEDLDVGLKMLTKRKLDLFPSKIDAIQEIKQLFKENATKDMVTHGKPDS